MSGNILKLVPIMRSQQTAPVPAAAALRSALEDRPAIRALESARGTAVRMRAPELDDQVPHRQPRVGLHL